MVAYTARVRFLVVLIAIAGACDLQPPPKKAPPAATSTPTPAAPSAVPTPEPALPPADAGVAAVASDAAPAPPDAMEVSDRCVQLGSHVAEVLISEAGDPAKKSVLVQDRAKIVRRTAESCTRDAWTAELITCYLAAKSQATLQACRKPDPPPPKPAPDDGLGPR
jgi:hypothetical protein